VITVAELGRLMHILRLCFYYYFNFSFFSLLMPLTSGPGATGQGSSDRTCSYLETSYQHIPGLNSSPSAMLHAYRSMLVDYPKSSNTHFEQQGTCTNISTKFYRWYYLLLL